MGALRRTPGIYKTPDEIRRMVAPGLATAASLDAVRGLIAPGVTTGELDAAADAAIRALGGHSNFQLVPGYRHTVCVSVNDEVVHGIPGDRVLQPGDIVSVDSGAEIDGWNGDSAMTVVVPDPARPDVVEARERLSRVTEDSLWAGIARLATASHLNEVGEPSRRASRRPGRSASSWTTRATASAGACTRIRRCSTTACAARALR